MVVTCRGVLHALSLLEAISRLETGDSAVEVDLLMALATNTVVMVVTA
jgi:hypothetical protein